ncbi:MAG: 4Fe-4S binding protein [Solirubrobacterales bacterium]
MKSNKIFKWTRFLLLMALLIWITYEGYMHKVLGGGKAASVHALCPYGALESLYTLVFTGVFIQKIYAGTLILLILTMVLALIFRRSFCGLLCPFGALQELFGSIRQKIIFKKRYTIPEKIDRPTRFIKHVVLILTIGTAWYYGTLWMAPFDPYSAYGHISNISGSLSEEPLGIVGFILLIVTTIGSFVYDRFFCKYLCPMGAFYGIISKISPTRIERNNDMCLHCKACSKACPVNIEVHKEDKITTMECINCNLCVATCPKKGTLEIKTGKKTMSPMLVLIIVVVMFFGTIFTAKFSGNFEILPASIKSGETIQIQDIKGYYTIEEAAKATGLTLEEIYEKLDIPNTVSKETKMKDISKEVPDFNFDTAKEKAGE